MEESVLLPLADLCQQITIVIALFAYFPLWKSLLRKRSSKHISLQAWTLWSISGTLALVYAIVQNYASGLAWALLLSTSANFTCLLVTIGLIVAFREKEMNQADEVSKHSAFSMSTPCRMGIDGAQCLEKMTSNAL